jgi:predicted MFS family arabinose efflux permease
MHGIGSAMVAGTTVALLVSSFPPGMRGRALGINVTAVYLGLSLGPFLGRIITQYLGWRSLFLVNVPFGLIVTALIIKKLEGEWAEASGESFDLTGTLIYSLMLFALIYSLTLMPSRSGGEFPLVGLIGLVAFIKWELQSNSPILNLDLLRKNRVFALSNLEALINYGATFAVAFLLSLYLQYIKGLDPRSAGLIMVSQPLVQSVLSPWAGNLSDRMEPRIVASAGMGITALGLAALIFLKDTTNLSFIVLILVILGIGLALFSSPNTNAVMRLMGRVQITPELYPQFIISTKAIFSVFTLLCVGGIFASLSRGRLR